MRGGCFASLGVTVWDRCGADCLERLYRMGRCVRVGSVGYRRLLPRPGEPGVRWTRGLRPGRFSSASAFRSGSWRHVPVVIGDSGNGSTFSSGLYPGMLLPIARLGAEWSTLGGSLLGLRRRFRKSIRLPPFSRVRQCSIFHPIFTRVLLGLTSRRRSSSSRPSFPTVARAVPFCPGRTGPSGVRPRGHVYRYG